MWARYAPFPPRRDAGIYLVFFPIDGRCGQLQVLAGHLRRGNDFWCLQLVADKWLGQEQIEQVLRVAEGPEGPTHGYC